MFGQPLSGKLEQIDYDIYMAVFSVYSISEHGFDDMLG